MIRLAVFLVLASACSSQTDTYCNRTCAKQAACMPGFDKSACTDDCKNASSTVIAIVRSDYLNPFLDCVPTADCSNPIGSCATKARMAITPSAACSSFCMSYIQHANSCGVPVFGSQDACTDKWKIYTDDAFKNATPCLTKSCGELASCVGNVLVPQ